VVVTMPLSLKPEYPNNQTEILRYGNQLAKVYFFSKVAVIDDELANGFLIPTDGTGTLPNILGNFTNILLAEGYIDSQGGGNHENTGYIEWDGTEFIMHPAGGWLVSTGDIIQGIVILKEPLLP
jgi:hypothetical protein